MMMVIIPVELWPDSQPAVVGDGMAVILLPVSRIVCFISPISMQGSNASDEDDWVLCGV